MATAATPGPLRSAPSTASVGAGLPPADLTPPSASPTQPGEVSTAGNASTAQRAVQAAELLQLALATLSGSDTAVKGAGNAAAGVDANGAPALLPANLSVEDAVLMIGALNAKLQDLQTQQVNTNVKSNQTDLEKKNADKLKEVQKWLNDLTEAANAKKSAGIWGWIKSIFSVVAAAVAVALTAGASTPLLLLAVVSLAGSVTDLISQIRTAQGLPPLTWTISLGQGVASLIGLIPGVSEEAMMWIRTGVDIAVGLVAVGAGIANTMKGAASATKAATEAGNKASSLAKSGASATEIADAAVETNKAVLNIQNTISASTKAWRMAGRGTQAVSTLGAGGAAVGQGFAMMDVAEANLNANTSVATQKKLSAEILQLMRNLEQNADDLQKVMEEIGTLFSRISKILTGQADMKSQILGNLRKGVTA